MRWIVPMAVAIALSACNGNTKQEVAELKSDNASMTSKAIRLQEDKAGMETYLDDLKERVSGMVVRHQNTAYDAEYNELGTGSMDYHLTALSEYMETNRWELSQLRDSLLKEKGHTQTMRSKLKKAGKKEATYLFALEDAERTIDDMVAQLDLEMELVDAIQLKYEEAEALRKQAVEETNKVRIAYGTRQELKKYGLAKRQGGVLGLGGALVSDTGSEEWYHTLDKRMTTSIPFPAEKCRMISSHPEGSYEWLLENEQSVLMIKDPEAFWRGSKTLTMMLL